MKINIGEYLIESDSMQFIVKEKKIVQDGVNRGNAYYIAIAYCCKFDEVLRFIPNEVLRTNDDISTIIDKLNQIQADIRAIKEIPQINDKDTIAITKEEYNSLLESDKKLTVLEGAGVDNWEGYDYAMKFLNQEEEGE